MEDFALASAVESHLVLRTCGADMVADGISWPASGAVASPDWDPAVSGTGLYGLLWGEGDLSLLSSAPDAKWLLVEVNGADLVHLDGRVKFPRGVVVFAGHWLQAYAILRARLIAPHPPCPSAAARGPVVTARPGDHAVTLRNWSHAAAAGDAAHAVTAGEEAHAAALGSNGSAVSRGQEAHAVTVGEEGRACTSGEWAHAVAVGQQGTVSASGENAIAAALGLDSVLAAGEKGVLVGAWFDEASNRLRVAVGYVGEGGIEPGRRYRVRRGRFVPAEAVASEGLTAGSPAAFGAAAGRRCRPVLVPQSGFPSGAAMRRVNVAAAGRLG